MNDSILVSIKKLLGLTEEDTSFDTDLIIHINSVFFMLNQLGVGSERVFSITDSSTEWTDFTRDVSEYSLIKSYMFLKVKLMFDPPNSSSVLDCYKAQITEYEWRINVMRENKKEETNE